MKKLSKNMNIKEIVDAICELEGYEEYLEYRLDHVWNSAIRERSRIDLKETRRKLTILYTMLDFKVT